MALVLFCFPHFSPPFQISTKQEILFFSSSFTKAVIFLAILFLVRLLLLILDDGKRVLDGVKDDVLDLELVLGQDLTLGQLPQLLHQVVSVAQILGRGEVHRRGDARVDVADLEFKK